MKFVIQRVTEANVKVDNKIIGEIGKGFMVLIGVGQEDTKEIADKMIKKMVGCFFLAAHHLLFFQIANLQESF